MAKPQANKQPQGHTNILQALILHKQQKTLEKAQKQAQAHQGELKTLQGEHEELKKKRDLDAKLHEVTRKDLENFKKQYDVSYILETKAVRKDTMKRARLAKTSTKKAVAKESRKKPVKPKGASK